MLSYEKDSRTIFLSSREYNFIRLSLQQHRYLLFTAIKGQ
jgi:hypothetical protein